MYCTEPQLRTSQTNSIQIDVLNDDFNATNSDFNTVHLIFWRCANVGISFVLKFRKATTKTSWGTRDVMKQTKVED
jgi:hypothetical protein